MIDHLIDALADAQSRTQHPTARGIVWTMLAIAIAGSGHSARDAAVLRLAKDASFRARNPDRLLKASLLMASGSTPARVSLAIGETISFRAAQKMRVSMSVFMLDALERYHGIQVTPQFIRLKA